MEKKEQSHNQNYLISKKKLNNEHRIGERREKGSPGFTYITTVGWICSRENIRRKGDIFLF